MPGWILLVAVTALLAACAPPGAERPSAEGGADAGADSELPPSARPSLVESLRADLASVRHPADGGGRAWLKTKSPAVAARPGCWTIVFEAGPEGIAVGGAVFLQVSPFWGWSTPQVQRRGAPGYTEVSTTAAGVELVPQTLDQQLLGIEIAGRDLAAGERLEIAYGVGEAGARADRYAERRSPFWIAVDGDGDGVRGLLDDVPAVDVAAGPAARLLLSLTSTARPGESLRLTLAVLDAVGNSGVDFVGRVELEVSPGDGRTEDLATGPLAPGSLPGVVELGVDDSGATTIELPVVRAGVLRLDGRAVGANGIELHATSNPAQVSDRGGRILWGDLQNHSGYSDGTALPADLLSYARDVAALDVVALTDHDHWGMRFLDATASMWEEIQDTTQSFHEPGRFVTLLGYEWTNWIYGHRHVLFFDPNEFSEIRVLSSVDPAFDTPEELWDGLRGRKAMTVAHHSAGGPVAVDWRIAPDAELETVTEIVSVHGSSEAPDSPLPIYRPVADNWIRDALARGYRFGFIGSSDGHDGHPGLGHLASPSGGLVAILAEDATRDGVYSALRDRAVYATNGPRIILRASFGGHRMGSIVPPGSPGPLRGVPVDMLVAQILAPSALRGVDVVRGGIGAPAIVVGRIDCGGRKECALSLPFDDVEAGEHVYLRAVQEDGGAAWSSPFYFGTE